MDLFFQQSHENYFNQFEQLAFTNEKIQLSCELPQIDERDYELITENDDRLHDWL